MQGDGIQILGRGQAGGPCSLERGKELAGHDVDMSEGVGEERSAGIDVQGILWPPSDLNWGVRLGCRSSWFLTQKAQMYSMGQLRTG